MYIMCPPTCYKIEYSINPWMDTDVQPDNNAWNQWLDVYSAILNTREKVSLVAPEKGLSDQVFAANYGSFIDDNFLLSTFKHTERAPEKLAMARWCVDNGITVMSMPEGMCFEGDGDLIKIDNNAYAMGYGFRTDYEACKFIQDITGKEIIPLQLKDPYFYHLDTCFFVVPRLGTPIIVYHPEAFEEKNLGNILGLRWDPIEVDKDEAMNFACNSIVYGNKGNPTILMSNENVKIGTLLRRYGCNVRYINVSEYCKAGGGVKCLVLHKEEN